MRRLAQFELLGLLELVVSLEVLTYLQCLASLIIILLNLHETLGLLSLFGLLAIELHGLVCLLGKELVFQCYKILGCHFAEESFVFSKPLKSAILTQKRPSEQISTKMNPKVIFSFFYFFTSFSKQASLYCFNL